ncbi:hypothetical protein MHZ92_10100 [Sporosarcina sp. ACRSL]|uniref:hypothetical protein n=1 Tax=Sporosarcina sp. ACRSL TaxID=2918215 RepID=UPI001EF5BD29|nr:hypothetical protein [Sporosarcina sp. ACRSL]MCG7344487.1 hypothetical protein [Sporosarcina sp. ACRSL]
MRNLIVMMTIALICFVLLEEVNADSDSFGEVYIKGGYKEVSKAVQEGEDHFKRKIGLPTQLPPIPFTHSMGRFSDLEGNENDHLEVFFINKDSPQNHFLIRIRPIEYGLEIREEQIERKAILEDGSQSIFTTTAFSGFNLLVLEKEGWQYTLLIDKRISDLVTQEILVSIANSIT